MYYKKKLLQKLITINKKITELFSEVDKISLANKTYAILDGYMEGWMDESFDGWI